MSVRLTSLSTMPSRSDHFVLAVVNNAAKSMEARLSLRDPDFSSFGHALSRVAGSRGSLPFRYPRNHHTAFPGGRTSLHPHRCRKVSFPPRPSSLSTLAIFGGDGFFKNQIPVSRLKLFIQSPREGTWSTVILTSCLGV